jgi:RNA polymerase sigma-70 factor (ECF subfamily)
MKDIDIVKLYFERSEIAIGETIEKYGKYLFSIAKNILSNNQDSEECVSDTYMKAWNSIPPQVPQNLSTYLGRITRNNAINRYNLYSANKRGGNGFDAIFSELELCIPSDFSVDYVMDEKLLVELIDDFLNSVSDLKRNVFIRRYWYCESISKIAEDFSVSESKVTSILYRMRIKLREKLEKEGITI